MLRSVTLGVRTDKISWMELTTSIVSNDPINDITRPVKKEN